MAVVRAGLTARQQRVLRGYDDWLLAWILTFPDEGIRHAKASGLEAPRYVVDGVEHWMETTKDGIRLTRYAHGGGELLTWAAVRAHARRLDPALVRALAAACQACNEHRGLYRPRSAAWRQRQEALEAERGALLDRCLPLAHADEPPGLFEQAP